MVAIYTRLIDLATYQNYFKEDIVMYDLYCEFDLDKHVKAYPYYTEVIILPSGRVEYAVPSHQEKLIQLLMEKWNCSRNDVANKCPRNMWCDYLEWLLRESKCVAVWYDHFVGTPNRFQRIVLDRFVKAGAMRYGVNEYEYIRYNY